MKIKRLLPLLLFCLVWLPGVADAQTPTDELDLEPESVDIDWQEINTEKFTIVYAESVVRGEERVECVCGVDHADYYAAFIDDVYDDLAVVFETELDLPVNLRLFPDEDSYYSVNPLAQRLTGVVAHALNSRDEIAIALPRTQPLTDEQILNNLRHEMTHLFASSLAEGKLNAGFQEGIAQYLEQPTEESAQDPLLLEQALNQDRLLAWEEFDQPEKIYGQSQIAYPQTLSIVSFLIDRYGLDKFREFLRLSAEEPGYRSALEAAYGQPPDALEQAWLDYLPEYFAGRWRINAIYAFDLSKMRQLVDQGAYSAAEAELTEIISVLEATDQVETLAEAEALLATVRQGQIAASLAGETRSALQAGDYTLAVEKGRAAVAAYNDLNYQERMPELQNYISRAELGQQALARLAEGERLLTSIRFFEAEGEIYEATALLQKLDNQSAAQRGEALLLALNWRKRLIIYGLLAVALLLLVFNALRRIYDRFLTKPLEVEFT